jgi:hypothetical protein
MHFGKREFWMWKDVYEVMKAKRKKDQTHPNYISVNNETTYCIISLLILRTLKEGSLYIFKRHRSMDLVAS